MQTVMIWIYGGGFQTGKSNTYPGSMLAVEGNVVVVTINYRVNLFGFLTTGDNQLKGNWGLWDQKLAIEWVKNNIAEYGGNPESITIFGESAGGRSVSFQMFSPQNNATLFQRAITESGSALSLTFINRDPWPVTNHVANSVHCDEKQENIATCLRSKTTSELLDAVESLKQRYPFFPIVDKEFVPYDLGKMFRKFDEGGNFQTEIGNFASYDLLSGWNDQDGLLYVSTPLAVNRRVTGNDLSSGISTDVLIECLHEFPLFNYPKNETIKTFVIDILTKFYLNNPDSRSIFPRSAADFRLAQYSEIAGKSRIVVKSKLMTILRIWFKVGVTLFESLM